MCLNCTVQNTGVSGTESQMGQNTRKFCVCVCVRERQRDRERERERKREREREARESERREIERVN